MSSGCLPNELSQMCALTTILISSVRALRKGNKVCRLRAVLPLPLAQQGHVQLSFSPSVLNTGCSTQRLDFELYIETQANTRVQGCDIGLYSGSSGAILESHPR